MILPIIALLLITEATAVSCAKDVSTVTLELRDEIVGALNEGIDTSDINELQYVEVEREWINLHVWTYEIRHDLRPEFRGVEYVH